MTQESNARFDSKLTTICDVVDEQPGITLPEIVQSTGFPKNTVRYNLLLLLAYRIIERREIHDAHRPGPRRYAYYPIVDEEADR